MASTGTRNSSRPKNRAEGAGKSLKASGPAIKIADSKITPQSAKAYASVSVKDGRNGQAWDLPVLKGTLGPDVIDVRKLYTDHALFTYDPGYGSTGSTQSAIT